MLTGKRIWRKLCSIGWQQKMQAYYALLRLTNQFPSPQTDHAPTSGKVIYLTFDDGPGKFTKQLLEILERYSVKATFFVTNCTNNADLLPLIAAGGHSIGNHTACHNYKELYTRESLFLDSLKQMESIIWEKTGLQTRLFRFPGGSISIDVHAPQRGMAQKLTSLVENQGYQYFDWDLDSRDTANAQTPGAVYRTVTAGLRKRKTTVLLQHDIKKHSVDAVEAIIVWGLRKGYTFLPLCEDSPVVHLEPED